MRSGIKLLLLFAVGALKDPKTKCHNPDFLKEIIPFLQGDSLREANIQKALPEKMGMAWELLCGISKKMFTKPLERVTVETYVLGSHYPEYSHSYLATKTGDKRSAVFAGRVVSIDRPNHSLIVQTVDSKTQEVFFIDPFGEDIKEGMLVAFHHYYLVCPINQQEAETLNKITF